MCATWGRKLIQMKCAWEGRRWENVGKAGKRRAILDIICCDFSILGHLGLALICANRRKCQTSQRAGRGNWCRLPVELFASFPHLITPSEGAEICARLLLSPFRDQKSDEQNFSRTNFPLMRVAPCTGFSHYSLFFLLVLLRDFSHLAHAHTNTHEPH